MVQTRNERALILMYHRVAEPNDEPDLHELKVDPRNFDAHVQHLCRHYRVVSLPQLVEQIASGGPRWGSQVVITFDDGYADNYANAYPVLRKHGAVATIFLPTNYVDGRAGVFWWERLRLLLWGAKVEELTLEMTQSRVYPLRPEERLLETHFALNDELIDMRPRDRDEYLDRIGEQLGVELATPSKALTWIQVREMSEQGVLFGSHTQSHASVASLSSEEFRGELQQSRLEIESHTGQKVDTFAYPYGHPASFNEASKTSLKETGFTCACSTVQGCVDSGSDVYALNRLMVKNWSEAEFAARVRDAFTA